jgi:GT2 family glycosyltransferase
MAPSVTAIVIDNASRDRTVDQVRSREGVCLIANRENRGFAAAVNQGVHASDAGFLLLLNPDVFLLSGVERLVEASRQYGLASGKLVSETRIAQKGFTIRRFPTPLTLWFELLGLNRLWPSNPVNRRYRYLDRDLDAPGLVEQPAGAFLMFRKDVWERLGGLDEGFHPIWFEDVDFCRRAAAAGYPARYVSEVAAIHSGAHSISQIPQRCRASYWCASLLRYAAKHFRSSAYRGLCLAVLLTSVPRAVAGMIRERSLFPLLSSFRIMRFAGRGLSSGAVQEESRRFL